MKFGLELEGSLFPLWRSYYVDYDGLKNLLDELKDNFPYMKLFKTHQLHIDHDPLEPFKFLISGVTFQFKDHESGSTHTGTLKILSVRVREEPIPFAPQEATSEGEPQIPTTTPKHNEVSAEPESEAGAFPQTLHKSDSGTNARATRNKGSIHHHVKATRRSSPTGSDIVDEVDLGATFAFDLCSSVAFNPNKPPISIPIDRNQNQNSANYNPSENGNALVKNGNESWSGNQPAIEGSGPKAWLGNVLDSMGATNANQSANANAFTHVRRDSIQSSMGGNVDEARLPLSPQGSLYNHNEPICDTAPLQPTKSNSYHAGPSSLPQPRVVDPISQSQSQHQGGLNETTAGNGGGGTGVAFCDLVPPPKHVELFHLDPCNATLLKRTLTSISNAEFKTYQKSKATSKKGDENIFLFDEKDSVTFDNYSAYRKHSSSSAVKTPFDFEKQSTPRYPSPQANLDVLAASIRFPDGDANPSIFLKQQLMSKASFAASPQSAGSMFGGNSFLPADQLMVNVVVRMLDVLTVGYADPQFSSHLYRVTSDDDFTSAKNDVIVEDENAISDPHTLALRQIQRLQRMTLHTRSVLGLANEAERRKAPKNIAPHIHQQHKAGNQEKPETTLRKRRGSVIGNQSLFPYQVSSSKGLKSPLKQPNETNSSKNKNKNSDDTNAYVAPMEPDDPRHQLKPLVSRDLKMKQLQRLHQLDDLYNMRLTMHFYINKKYFSGDPDRQQLSPSLSENALITSSKRPQVSYCNPAIAHALYAFQRSVSATLAAALQIEIEKASNFYLSQTHILCRSALLCIDSVKMWDKLTTRDRAQLRTVYRQTYLTFRILQQFCDLNIIAIGKYLKKVDKNLLLNSLENYRNAIETLNFRMGHNSRITALQKLMAEKLATHAMNGSIKKAVTFLETTRDEGAEFTTSHVGGGDPRGGARFGKSGATLISLAFMWGVFLSIVAMIIVLLASSGARGNSILYSDLFAQRNAEYLILIPFLIALPQFLFSINVMTYERFGINYAFMFELDPIFHWSGAELMRDSLIYLFAWAVCVFVFLRNGYNALSCSDGIDHAAPIDGTPSVAPLWAIFPIFLIIWLGIAAYNKFISVEQRQFWSAHVFWHIITTPYYSVRFADFFVCNYLTSMTTTIFELQWYWCTFTTSSLYECTAGRSMAICILNSLPNTWRMMQSIRRYLDQPKATRKPFPNLINAGKYFTGVVQPIVWTGWAIARFYGASDEVLTTMYALSFASQLITQTYKYIWDIVVDAGIFIDYGKNGYEWRKERVYKAWWPYLLFMAVDFAFRWRWLMTYYIQLSFRPPWFFAVWAIMELIRRTFWSMFRVENEHVNNTEHYRATKLAPIPVKNIHVWDTFSPDSSPEQFLTKSRKNQFSKEFPSIKGVNLSSVTRFFASLPEKEKLSILLNSPLCAGFVSSAEEEEGKHEDPNNEAAAVDLNQTLDASRIGLHTKYISAHSIEAEEGKNTPGTIPNRSSKLSTFVGAVGEGKTKFFSELPEEYKIIVIVGHLKSETMNAFERRIKAEEAAEKEKKLAGGAVTLEK